MNISASMLQNWIGRTEVRTDLVTAAPAAALAAMLDRADGAWQAGAALPPAWHWLYFLPAALQSDIGPDGHPRRGGFLPPVPLPRRMWAGSQMSFQRPLRIGAEITRTSSIVDVRLKEGRSGSLVFVGVEHRIEDTAVLLTDRHDIVYRDVARPGEDSPQPRAAPADAAWLRDVQPDPVLLFRYSALTFNGHRIHYDRPYATEVEAYPGLVVHGPLIATLLLDLLRRECPARDLRAFSFRAVRPMFAGRPFQVCGRPSGDSGIVQLWAQDADGWLAMEATAELAP